MFWVGVCLGAELINVGISMVVGVLWGDGDYVIGVRFGSIKVAQRVGIVVVLGGRAWVSSLPKFFVGKYFHFWKPPPLFCIKS